MPLILALALFVGGAALAIWSTELLIQGLVGLALLLRVSAFAVGAVFSGLEVENIAVGLAAGHQEAASIALGTVFGGAVFLVCVALGLGALLFPLQVRLPRGFIVLFALSPLASGIVLFAPVTPRLGGAALLLLFAVGLLYLVRASRGREFLESEEVDEALEEVQEKRRPLSVVLTTTLFGLVAIGVAGEMVARGAVGLIAGLGVPALVMGMVISPAAVEIEEVFRQAVPSHEGRHDVSAGNLVGTMLYFVLFNLGLIALLTPVRVAPVVRALDWPFLVGATWLAAAFLLRGKVGRGAGVLLLTLYAIFVVLQIAFA